MIEYKGFKILRASGYSGGYQIHKDNKLFSQLILISQDTCKKVIDTWIKRCGEDYHDLFDRNIKKQQLIIIKEPQKPITVREVYLSEHEKYIEKLLAEK